MDNLAGGDSLMAEQVTSSNINGGSIPTSPLQKTPYVKRLTSKETNSLLESWHYLGKVRGIICSYGHTQGCCVFTNLRSKALEKKLMVSGNKPIELARMVGCPKHSWSMSSLMSVSVKLLHKDFPEYNLIITYADPFAKHDGKVYVAAGWLFYGLSGKTGNPIYKIDGRIVASRTLYDRHGTQALKKMQAIYKERLQWFPNTQKKRFIKWIT